MVPPGLGRRSRVHLSRPTAAILSWLIILSIDFYSDVHTAYSLISNKLMYTFIYEVSTGTKY